MAVGKGLAPYADAPLSEDGGATVSTTLGKLCEDKPLLIMAVRRPGCVLCRDQALKLWEARGEFEAAGYSVICVVHEWIDREIQAFKPAFWQGPLYLDTSKQLYKLLGGGEVRKGSLAAFLNPFSQAWKNVRQAKKRVSDSNLTGDGLTMGGMVAVSKGGASVEAFPERDFGEYPPMADVLSACKKLVG